MKILTCRECGHREISYSGNGLMNRVKMFNHLEHKHLRHGIETSQVRLMVREENEFKIAEEAYRLQASY